MANTTRPGSIGLRHHRSKENKTDAGHTGGHIRARDLIAFSAASVVPMKPSGLLAGAPSAVDVTVAVLAKLEHGPAQGMSPSAPGVESLDSRAATAKTTPALTIEWQSVAGACLPRRRNPRFPHTCGSPTTPTVAGVSYMSG